MDDYKLFCKDRQGVSRVGVALYVKENLECCNGLTLARYQVPTKLISHSLLQPGQGRENTTKGS